MDGVDEGDAQASAGLLAKPDYSTGVLACKLTFPPDVRFWDAKCWQIFSCVGLQNLDLGHRDFFGLWFFAMGGGGLPRSWGGRGRGCCSRCCRCAHSLKVAQCGVRERVMQGEVAGLRTPSMHGGCP